MSPLRPILTIIGILLTVLSIAMLIPAFVDLAAHNPDWINFAASAFLTAFIGIILFLTNRGKHQHFGLRQAFILTTTSWIILALFSSLPFLFSQAALNFTDAFFESMSGLTTTGATIFVGLDTMPPGILIWRSILQWLGGIGIIVVALAVLPMLQIGGMQLFRTESSDKSEKILPRAAQISLAIGSIYTLLTIICAFTLWLFGMSKFDAINHAMTTIATAGFSTHDASIGYFNSAQIETVITFFMIMSGIPFVLYIQLLRGDARPFFKDTQIHFFLSLLLINITAITLWLHTQHDYSLTQALRYASFNVTAVMTTTGYSSTDYAAWGSFALTLLYLLSVVGGCTGSTTGGIKIFRFQMLYQTAKTQINHLIQPHAVFKPRFNDKPVNENITASVMSFIILFAFCFLIIAVFLSLTGLDYLTSMSTAAATLSNLGPALGPISGPSGTYASFTDTAKWLLSFAMLIGRLEIFTVLVLFSPYFWRD